MRGLPLVDLPSLGANEVGLRIGVGGTERIWPDAEISEHLPPFFFHIVRLLALASTALAAGLRGGCCSQELTYNYHADTLEGFVERQKCLCGEPQCSGFIGGEVIGTTDVPPRQYLASGSDCGA